MIIGPPSNQVSCTPSVPGTLYVYDAGELHSFRVSGLIAADAENPVAAFEEATGLNEASFSRIFFDDAGNFYGWQNGTTIYKYDSAYNLLGTITLARNPQTHQLAMRRSDGTWFYADSGNVYRADNDGSNEASLSNTIDFCRAMDFDEDADLLYVVHRVNASSFELYSITPEGSQNLITSSGPASWGSAGRAHVANGFFVCQNGSSTLSCYVYDLINETFDSFVLPQASINGVAITDEVLIHDQPSALHKSDVDGGNLELVYTYPTARGSLSAFRFLPD